MQERWDRNSQGIAALADQLAVLGNANRLAILTNSPRAIQSMCYKKLGLANRRFRSTWLS